MADVGYFNRRPSGSRRTSLGPLDLNLLAGRIAVGASFLFIALVVFGL